MGEGVSVAPTRPRSQRPAARTARETISKRLRFEILRRDRYTCRYCGGSAPDVVLTVDHVIPVTLGGATEPANLAAACKDCNAGKSSVPADAEIVADVDQRSARWARAMTVAIEQRASELAEDREHTHWFDSVWTAWTRGGEVMPRNAGWKNSVLRFLAGGLDREFIEDAVCIAMGNELLNDDNRWRYFCGICWKEVDRVRGMAVDVAENASSVASPPQASRIANDPFPYMYVFERLIDDIVEALGCDPSLRGLINDTIWDCMPHAHGCFMKMLATEASSDEALDAVLEDLSTESAWLLNKLRMSRAAT